MRPRPGARLTPELIVASFMNASWIGRKLEHDPEKWEPVFGEIMLHERIARL
jgi:hypothetical protein